MPKTKKPRKKLRSRGKQHDARAASFKRIAKALRAEARAIGPVALINARQIARVFDAEAKLLRSMR
jgi:hypothetical protein